MGFFKKNSRRTYRFESLELRNLLAGNVTTSVTSGQLVITGDSASNEIVITQVDPTTYKVAGTSGTKVDGHSSSTVPGITIGINVQLNDGNDAVTLKNLSLNGMILLMGNGNDTVVATGCTESGGVGFFEGADGNNTFTITNCIFNAGLTIAGHAGRDTVAMSKVSVIGGLQIELGDGANALSMSNVTVSGQQVPPVEDVPRAGAIITTGSGADVIAMNNVNIVGFTQIDTQGGNDSVTIANSSFGNPVTVTETGPPDGTNSPNIDASLNDHNFGLYLQTGLGNDAVTVSNTKIFGTIYVDTSNEVTADGPAPVLTSYNIKDGNDSVAFLKVTVLKDTPAPDNRSDSGQIQIYTGSQSDAIALNTVNTDGGALIFATDLAFDASTTDGADTVVVTNSSFDRQNGGVNFFFDDSVPVVAIGLVIQTGNGNDTVIVANVHSIQAVVIETGEGADHVAISSLVIAPEPIDNTVICLLEGGNYDTLTVVDSTAGTANFNGGGNTGDTLVQSGNHFTSETHTDFDHVVG